MPDPAQVRQHLEKTVANKAIGKKVADSDDSDNLVTGRATGRNRKRVEIYASGGVAKGDKPGGYPSRAQRTRNMREDTREILTRRSSSASLSASKANSLGAESRRTTPAAAEERDTTKSAKESTMETANARKGGVANGVSHTPQAETSVLGRIKPRKRQASILQLIQTDAHDDSTLLSRDEADFLPDAVSTPLPEGRSAAPAGSSLKRKRGSDMPESVQSKRPTSASNSTAQPISSPLRPSPEISPPTRSQMRKLSLTGTRPKAQEEDSVMALPESSDSEESTDENEQAHRASFASAKKIPPLAPSTEQLQNLMPSKRHQSSRPRQARDAFDIPDDSQSNSEAASGEEQEHSAFLPTRSRKAHARAGARSKATQSSRKPTANGVKTRAKLKSTNNTTSLTPSPVRVRTPLPLSSVQRTTRNTQAKSPSKQGTTATTTAMRDKTTNATSTPLTTARGGKANGKKQYGGSRRRGTGKENQLLALSDRLSGDEGTIEVNMNAGSPVKKATRSDFVNAPEIKAWKKKWADIDDFEMDFEEVSASTRSSSPMAR